MRCPSGAKSRHIPILDLEAIRAGEVHHTPYDYMMGSGAVRAGAVPALRDDFPDIKPTGYHPLEQMAVKGAFADLIREIEGCNSPPRRRIPSARTWAPTPR